MAMDYRITIKGHLGHHWSAWFEGLTITHCTSGETLLDGPIEDQAALYGALIKIRDLGLQLIAVVPVTATTDECEDTFRDNHAPKDPGKEI